MSVIESHKANFNCDLKIPIMSLCDNGNNPTLNDIKISIV